MFVILTGRKTFCRNELFFLSFRFVVFVVSFCRLRFVVLSLFFCRVALSVFVQLSFVLSSRFGLVRAHNHVFNPTQLKPAQSQCCSAQLRSAQVWSTRLNFRPAQLNAQLRAAQLHTALAAQRSVD